MFIDGCEMLCQYGNEFIIYTYCDEHGHRIERRESTGNHRDLSYYTLLHSPQPTETVKKFLEAAKTAIRQKEL